MKIHITEPPRNGRNEELIRWLADLADKLNIAFERIGEENLSEELRAKLEVK